MQAKTQSPFNTNKKLTGKVLEDFRRKKTETKISTFQKQPVEHTAPKHKVFWQLLCKF